MDDMTPWRSFEPFAGVVAKRRDHFKKVVEK